MSAGPRPRTVRRLGAARRSGVRLAVGGRCHRRDAPRATAAGGSPTGRSRPDGRTTSTTATCSTTTDTPRPDPRSRRQPAGVHERSRTFDPSPFAWTDQRLDRPAAGRARCIYELHVGTFTPEGTLDARDREARPPALDRRRPRRADAGQRLQRHPQLGLRRRAWFAVQRGVRRPAGVPALRRRLPRRRAGRRPGRRLQPPRPVGELPAAVRALPQARAATPGATWSTSTARARPRCAASSSTTPGCGSRTTTSTGCGSTPCTRSRDASPVHLLEELADRDRTRCRPTCGRPLTLIAESDLNDAALVTPREAGGYGLDAQWSDDFHHAVHVALTGETTGYYADFAPLSALAKVLRARASSTTAPGRRSAAATTACRSTPSTCRPGGSSCAARTTTRSATAPRGDRLTEHLDDDQLACAALLTLCGPFTPMLFMGEEWAASTPFQFFTSHPEPELGQGDRRGPDRGVRADGLGPVRGARPAGPGDLRALEAGLVGARRAAGTRVLLDVYRRLAALRRSLPELTDPSFGVAGGRRPTRRPGCSRCAVATCSWR